jgi:hypothetical protein
MKSRSYTHMELKQMHNREHKKTINIPFNDVNEMHKNTMKLDQRFFILIEVRMYMGSIVITIYLYNPTIFVLIYALILYISTTYSEKKNKKIDYNTYEGDF